ncbi:MAG: hypothetical protein ACHQIL_04860 [Steroidobacterales bacterium]
MGRDAGHAARRREAAAAASGPDHWVAAIPLQQSDGALAAAQPKNCTEQTLAEQTAWYSASWSSSIRNRPRISSTGHLIESQFDLMTGHYNRDEARSIVYIDHMHIVNDLHGFELGNEVIVRIAPGEARCAPSVRRDVAGLIFDLDCRVADVE